MYQLKIADIPLKPLWICDPSEAKDARSKGIPFIIKPKDWSDDKLIKAILFGTLKRLFPHVDWSEKLGINRRTIAQIPVILVDAAYRENPGFDTTGNGSEHIEVSDGYRETGGGFEDEGDDSWIHEDVDDYLGDFGSYVNMDILQQFKLLPKFMDDIATAIRTNLESIAWMDGYNKKLGVPTGYYSNASDAPNLIILDTSGSIPLGIAHTMISLIDTLRTQANADLIITSGRSKYWAANEELPTPKELSSLIGGCNECAQFYTILKEKVLGRHFGNVIVFGDNDSPADPRLSWRFSSKMDFNRAQLDEKDFQSTQIDNIMAFHTYDKRKIPGYGRWAKQCAPNAPVSIDTDWCDYLC
jgi:hypothetical protein